MPGADILSTDKNSVWRLFMSSQQFGISQPSFETLIKISKELFLHPFS